MEIQRWIIFWVFKSVQVLRISSKHMNFCEWTCTNQVQFGVCAPSVVFAAATGASAAVAIKIFSMYIMAKHFHTLCTMHSQNEHSPIVHIISRLVLHADMSPYMMSQSGAAGELAGCVCWIKCRESSHIRTQCALIAQTFSNTKWFLVRAHTAHKTILPRCERHHCRRRLHNRLDYRAKAIN